jgi:hypothetical protein
MEAEVEAVTDGDRNRDGGGGGNSNSDNGSSRQQWGQATINNMRRQLAAAAMAVGGGGGERRQTKTTTAAVIAAAMAEEAVVATTAMAATVTEAMAAETERQNSGVGILSLAYVVCRTVLLGKQWWYFGVFFSICMCKQIICKTDTDTCMCVFRLHKYNLQTQKWSFCRFICIPGQQKLSFGQKRFTNSQCNTKRDGAKADTVFCKAYWSKKISALMS